MQDLQDQNSSLLKRALYAATLGGVGVLGSFAWEAVSRRCADDPQAAAVDATLGPSSIKREKQELAPQEAPPLEPENPLRLVLIGGGNRPPEAMGRFVDWAGGKDARILIIPWASVLSPQEHLAVLSEEFGPFQPAKIEVALNRRAISKRVGEFLEQLKEATGIFITGGDQNRLANMPHEILDALRERYRAGVTFGGTSAGTAIMSQVMLTGRDHPELKRGNRAGYADGLGLFDYGVLDQHFIVRRRQERLDTVLRFTKAPVGVGIDEGAAIAVEDGRRLEVLGGGAVMILTPDQPRTPLILKQGDELDLKEFSLAPRIAATL